MTFEIESRKISSELLLFSTLIGNPQIKDKNWIFGPPISTCREGTQAGDDRGENFLFHNPKIMKKSLIVSGVLVSSLAFAHHGPGHVYASVEMPDVDAIINQAMNEAEKEMEKNMAPVHFSDEGMEITTEKGMVKYGESGIEVADEKGKVKYGKDGIQVVEGDESIIWDADGLRVKSKDGNVKYDKEGIAVTTGDEAVKIDETGVHVKDGDEELHVPMDGFMSGFFQNFFSFSWFPFWGN